MSFFKKKDCFLKKIRTKNKRDFSNLRKESYMISPRTSLWKDVLLLSVVLSLFFGLFLGQRPFASPDEGRYVEIPREMVVSGDYITPRLNGLKYFEKPVLFYWLQVLPIKLFGITEFSMRLWPLIFAVLGCLSVYLAGRRLFDRSIGLIASGILSTTLLYYALSHLIVLDLVFSVLVSCGLLCFIVGIQEPAGLKRRLYAWGFAALMALAVLTKGIAALAIGGCVPLIWILLGQRWKQFLPLYLPSSLAIFLAIALPWHIIVSIKNPEFFDFYIIHEHFSRYLTSIHRRYQPMWFFIPVIFVGFMPWTPFIFRALKKALPFSWSQWKTQDHSFFLGIWVAFVFLFFSFSNSKLITYMVPLFPPLSLLVAASLKEILQNKVSIKREVLTYAIVWGGVAAAFFIFKHKIPADDLEALWPCIKMLLIFFCTFAILVPVLYLWKGSKAAVQAIAASGVFLVLILIYGSNFMTRISAKEGVRIIKEVMPLDVEVVSYGTYYQDLPVYLNRLIKIADWQGELAFGKKVEDVRHIMLSDKDLWALWTSSRPTCIVTYQSRYLRTKQLQTSKHYIIHPTPQCMVICNQPPLKG
jgi:4-amino-4-deoxy-L-arabinose transferase-like glycosyltransferase